MRNDVTNNDRVNKEIEAFVKVLQRQGIQISKIILFGSYARGTADEASDIDLAVLSNNFGKDSIEEAMVLSKLSWQVSDRIEAVPLAPKEISRLYHPFIGEIQKYGKVVYAV
ncbi:nucleotidyltransferase domain-containing protein [Candidatus Roizmanbacteria bacterium CG_4_10_14_0_8_um_filter_39_9]|uniref:Nucleotidyltransferase domain-containing protein n=1 Tax=Candidatus Roizmanbacteria bacterium CG_4_10_14_0_8_um_filter_39_9 TaxID=1974829 RepID=A0A2M7QEI6_9BACT|nr:MAG: nucleotidyltransferase domain-containing protein [Candidatus Roizmanbacteria bacterium CG_4_10_14_0_8_um_filter_39_9]